MKKLIKFVVVTFIVLVFAFSSNNTVESLRNGFLNYGEVVYTHIVNWMNNNENEKVSNFGEKIK